MKKINGKLKPDNNFKWKFRKQLLAACFFLLVCITGITAAAKGMTENAGTNQTERIPGCGLADAAYSYDGGKKMCIRDRDKRGCHSEIENNRETEHGDFTDIENSGGQRNICDFPVMAFT